MRRPFSILLLLGLAVLPACGDFSDASGSDDSGGEAGTTGDPASETGEGDGDGDESGADGDGDADTTDDECEFDCGPGICVLIGDEAYCECPEGTDWRPQECGVCPAIDAAGAVGHDLELEVVSFEGRFLLGGATPPKSEYDDANVWLENPSTGDRVWLGNTHTPQFAVRVTPGIYDVIYEVETPGALMPHNPRVRLEKLALFDSQTGGINIRVASLSGEILLNEVAPPADEYDDANILFRDLESGNEVVAGNTHDGSYAVRLVPGDYDVVYRVETPGAITPRNDGAVIDSLFVSNDVVTQIAITSVPMQGEFMLNDEPAPASEYDDANIELESETAGTVALGNTHDGSYDVQVIPASYMLVYMHETGPNVPQNQRARFEFIDVFDSGPAVVEIPMVELSGALMINGAVPPANEFDDGLLHLSGVDSDDGMLLGNTHDGSYLVNLIPGSYDVYYSQETSGGTVPDNKDARLVAGAVVTETGALDIDVEAVAISGIFTFAGGQPPTSDYEDGRIYLRNTATEDAVLLGSTHDGAYTAVVVPGDYEVFYVQEAGGDVPGNQNALLDSVSIPVGMTLDLDVPVVSLSGQILIASGAAPDSPAPDSPADGGQLYLRALGGDSALLGDSFAVYATNLVAGTYGVYYRSEASVTMPQNENGRFACITIE